MLLATAAAVLASSACGATARLPVAAGTGPKPVFPPEDRSLIPTVNVVKAKGWAAGQTPLAGEGASVAAFAQGL